MINIIIKLIKNTVKAFINSSSELENYIKSKNPKSVAEIEHYATQYMNHEIKKNGFFYFP